MKKIAHCIFERGVVVVGYFFLNQIFVEKRALQNGHSFVSFVTFTCILVCSSVWNQYH